MPPKCARDRVGGSSQVFCRWHHQIKLIKKEPLDLATIITSLDSSNAALFTSPGGNPRRAQILETKLLLVGSFWPRLKMDNQQTTSTHMPPPPLTHLLYHLHDFKSTSYFVVTCISPNYHLMCQWFFQVTGNCLNEVQKAKKQKKLIFSSDLPKCIVPHFAQVPYQINEISSTSSDKDSRGHFGENKK